MVCQQPTCPLQCCERILVSLIIADVDWQHVSLLLQAQHFQQMQQRTPLVPVNLAGGEQQQRDATSPQHKLASPEPHYFCSSN
jgi:hypothetical protein